MYKDKQLLCTLIFGVILFVKPSCCVNSNNVINHILFTVHNPKTGNLIARIPTEHLSAYANLNTKPLILMKPSINNGCDRKNLENPLSQIRRDEFKDIGRDSDFILVVNHLGCDMIKKISNARTAGYTNLLIHDVNSNDLIESNIWASEITHYAKLHPTKMIRVYFIGQKYGRLLQDIFTYPNWYLGINITHSKETGFKFYLDKNYESEIRHAKEIVPPKPRKNQNQDAVEVKAKSTAPWFYIPPDRFEELLVTYLWFNPILAVPVAAVIFFFYSIFLLCTWFLIGFAAFLGLGFLPALIISGPFVVFQKICQLFGVRVGDLIRNPPPLPQQHGHRREVRVQPPIIPQLLAEQIQLPPELEGYRVAVLRIIFRAIVAAERFAGPGALNPEQIRNLPRVNYSPNLHEECSICLINFVLDESVTGLHNCVHIYHHDCISNWVSNAGTCPNCRRNVLPN